MRSLSASSTASVRRALHQSVEHCITEVQGVAVDDSVVWLLSREGDPYSGGLEQGLIERFPTALTDDDNFHPSVYPSSWPEWFTDTTRDLPAPDIVLLLGASESWTSPRRSMTRWTVARCSSSQTSPLQKPKAGPERWLFAAVLAAVPIVLLWWWLSGS